MLELCMLITTLLIHDCNIIQKDDCYMVIATVLNADYNIIFF
jgi:hypothetical protein